MTVPSGAVIGGAQDESSRLISPLAYRSRRASLASRTAGDSAGGSWRGSALCRVCGPCAIRMPPAIPRPKASKIHRSIQAPVVPIIPPIGTYRSGEVRTPYQGRGPPPRRTGPHVLNRDDQGPLLSPLVNGRPAPMLRCVPPDHGGAGAQRAPGGGALGRR